MDKNEKRETLIKLAMVVKEMFAQDPEALYLYELREKDRMSYLSALKTSEEEGFALGKKMGLAMSRENCSARTKRKIARSLKKEGFSLKEISKLTGMSIEEIKNNKVKGK
ncbi:MAG: hypothetical protein LBR11_07095 [Deltaproteobacteria bacterium]|jgi:predicted transposase/invertase (TIGR01784 family)|nr:hypothetical protein [Deltaproteobacteria bacterium]